MHKLALFARIAKVDAAQRIVSGFAIEEVADRTKEVFDYETSKGYFRDWSNSISKATDGKSLGNVRAMHGKVVAGKLTSIDFDDARKAIPISVKVVDDAEWAKVEEGVYTGFSIGGEYIKKWKDPDNNTLTRYTANPVEISLVDLPCVPTAHFTMVKMDGSTEERTFKPAPAPSAADVAAKAVELAKAAGTEDKWPEFIDQARTELTKVDEPAPIVVEDDAADPTLAKDAGKTDPAPIEPPKGEEIEQVWKSKRDGATFSKKADLIEHHRKLDADAATKAATSPVLAKLDAIGKELDKRDGGKTDPKTDDASAKPAAGHALKIARFAKVAGLSKAATAELLSKSLYDVGRLASLISELKWLFESLNYEALVTADGAMSPAQIKDAIAGLSAALRTLVVEETAELIGDGGAEQFEMAAGLVPHGHIDPLVKFAAETPELKTASDTLQKIGARNSAADKQRIQKMHDIAVELEAECTHDAGDGDKAAAGDLAKVVAERNAFVKALGDLTPKLDDILERVKRIEAQPLPGGPARTDMFSIVKGRDGKPITNADDLTKAVEGMTPDQLVDFVIKASQAKGLSATHFART